MFMNRVVSQALGGFPQAVHSRLNAFPAARGARSIQWIDLRESERLPKVE